MKNEVAKDDKTWKAYCRFRKEEAEGISIGKIVEEIVGAIALTIVFALALFC